MKYKGRIELEFNGLKLKVKEEDYKKLTKQQINTITTFDQEAKVKGNSLATRKNEILLLMLLARFVKKSFEQMTKKDIDNFLCRDLKESTRNWYKEVIKNFFTTLNKADIVKHLKSVEVADLIESKDLWTEEEIIKLIDVAHEPRDKCLVAMLFDFAIERKCIRNLNIEDIDIQPSGIYVSVTGKKRGNRQKRTLQALSSAPYIKSWLDNHPNKNDPTAPFFISFSGNSFGRRVSYNFAYDTLQVLRRRAKINKPIWTHLIRHSKITDLYKKGFRGVSLQQYAGWVNSNMEQRYVNLSPQEMFDQRKAAENGDVFEPTVVKKSILLSLKCDRCGELNESTNNYCKRCWFPLKRQVAQNETALLDIIRSKYGQMLKDSNTVDELVKKFNEFVDNTTFIQSQMQEGKEKEDYKQLVKKLVEPDF